MELYVFMDFLRQIFNDQILHHFHLSDYKERHTLFRPSCLYFEDNMTCGDGDILNNSQKRPLSTMLRSTSSQDKETVKRPKRKL